MHGLSAPVRWLAVLGAIGGVTTAAAAWSTGPLPPTVTPLYAVPPLLGGLYLAVAATWIRDVGLYGWLAGRLPAAFHVGAQAIGVALVGLGSWVLLALPAAGAGRLARELPELDALCRGAPELRLDREVLPTLAKLEALRQGQSSALIAAADDATHALLHRCADQARVAFDDPEGTHASWRKLRTWMAEHPDRHGLPGQDRLWSQSWRERAPPVHSPRPVPLILQP